MFFAKNVIKRFLKQMYYLNLEYVILLLAKENLYFIKSNFLLGKTSYTAIAKMSQ